MIGRQCVHQKLGPSGSASLLRPIREYRDSTLRRWNRVPALGAGQTTFSLREAERYHEQRRLLESVHSSYGR